MLFDSAILQGNDISFLVGLVVFVLGLIIVLAIFASAIKIIREYERVVQFRLGRLKGAKGPGIVLILPVVNRLVKVDLRERYLEVPHQTAITKDNAPVDIDFLIYYKVVDASQSIVQVQNFTGASVGLATTTLRAVVGDIPLDELLSKREQINSILRTRLDEVTERWGIKVTNVEIREIRPPKDVQDAMVKQMTAERSRRALVTESDGIRESSVLKAEGAKNAAILQAEGQKQSAILVAEGSKQSQILVADGLAQALGLINSSAKTVDARTMAIQYLDALKEIGKSPSTKYIFPMEFTSLVSRLKGFVEESTGGKARAEEDPSPH
ncbi:MAG TPA: SPFH domain-containing protein [Candidatus Bathyarchaeia archaeon]|nr:SPFH domain-containing protein [Candidatus Bathyarchaeia archaeon]